MSDTRNTEAREGERSLDGFHSVCDICHEPFVPQSGCLFGAGRRVCVTCAPAEIDKLIEHPSVDALRAQAAYLPQKHCPTCTCH